MRTADRVVFGQHVFRLASFAGSFLQGSLIKPCPWSRNPMLRTGARISFSLPVQASDRSSPCVCFALRSHHDPASVHVVPQPTVAAFPSFSFGSPCRVSPRTKMPPSLSNIQCLGALRRLRCFLVPRTPIVDPTDDEGGGGEGRSNTSRSNCA